MIEVKNIIKRFGPKTAVDDISFTVEKGQVLGFLGPNGAGKSTTMRMITGYFAPTSGSISVDGIDAVDKPQVAKSKIGYLPENAPLYTEMAVVDFITFCGQMRGLSGAELGKAVDRALDMCFLQSVRHQSIDTLSKGYRHRTCFAQSVIHDPDILILDEPTDGLDPNQKHEVRGMIKRMGEEKAIIFSTHILEEVEAACSRAMIIDQGRVVADGPPEELKARDAEAGSLKIDIRGQSGGSIRNDLSGLSAAGDITEIRSTETGLVALVVPKNGDGALPEQIFNLCRDKNLVLGEMGQREGRLDNVFRDITVSETKVDQEAEETGTTADA